MLASLVSLLLTKHRGLFYSRFFLWGGFLGVFIILLNLIWQFNHNWPVIHHLNELHANQLVNVSVAGFLFDQVMMNFPGFIIWITALIALLFWKRLANYRVLGYIYLSILLILLVASGKAYYTLGVYPVLFALGGYVIASSFRAYVGYGMLVLTLLLSIPMLPLSLPVYSHERIAAYTRPVAPFVNRWEDGQIYNIPQDFADMTGWKQLNEIVMDFYF